MIDFSELTIDVQLKNKGRLKALIGINYKGIRVTHFRILEDDKSEYRVILLRPSLKVGERWQKIFWTDSDEDYSLLEEKVITSYKEYLSALEGGFEKDNTPLDEIDIPI